MTTLTDHQRAEAHMMAALGLGWENICAAFGIRDAERQQAVRAIVLGKPRKQSTPLYKLLSDARKRAPRIRDRQLASTANRKVPITLAPVSCLGDDQ